MSAHKKPDLVEISDLVHYEDQGDRGHITVAATDNDDLPLGSQYIVGIFGPEGTAPDYRIIRFQNGRIDLNGVNGMTNEMLLSILIHRTKALDARVPSMENKMAIEHMEQAKALFEERTRQRTQRQVVGTQAA